MCNCDWQRMRQAERTAKRETDAETSKLWKGVTKNVFLKEVSSLSFPLSSFKSRLRSYVSSLSWSSLAHQQSEIRLQRPLLPSDSTDWDLGLDRL